MLTRSPNIRFRTTLVLGVLLCLVVPSTSVAAGPAAVTVRVEGSTETKVPPTLITTTNTSVVNDGDSEHSCSGTSALGALQLATSGNWKGAWSETEKQYFVDEIEGEGETVGSSKYYWSFWLNDTYEETGACDVQLENGDRVLFFPICYENCPPGAEPTPLEIEAPTSASTGEQVVVTVKQYSTKDEATPAVGASIEGGNTTVTTDSQGHATLTFSGAGSYLLKVKGAVAGPPAVRTETTICVHAGDDGTCGTAAPSKSGSPTPTPQPISTPEQTPSVLTTQIEGIREGHLYSRRHAPRALSGKIDSGAAVTSISLRLRRSYKGRCWAYSGTVERLRRVRCGHGSFFKINSQGSSFSYLLPSKLPPGRYVFEVEATNANGQHTKLKLGSSKIVFRVK